MNIEDLPFANQAYAMAVLARSAYLPNSRSIFNKYGFNQDYNKLSNKDVHAHVGCNDRYILITFRGNEFNDINELLISANAWPKSHGNGWVHAGFRENGRKIYLQILAYVKDHPNKNIIIAAHSMGAAMALYISGELEYEGYNNITIFSYGCPRMGNLEYVRSIKSVHHRFVNCNDIVSHLPPAMLGYRHHGTLHYISFKGHLRHLNMWQIFKDNLRARFSIWRSGKIYDGFTDHKMQEYLRKLNIIQKL